MDKTAQFLRIVIFVLILSIFLNGSNEAISQETAKELNYGWHVYNDSDTVIVFVHGIFSNSKSAWLNEQENVYWPDLISKDPVFQSPSIFLAGFYTEFLSGEYNIRDAANELYTILSVRFSVDQEKVLEKKNIMFIGHSTGGIVIRHMILRHIEEFKDKKLGIVLIASPSIGSKDADRLKWLSEFADNQMSMELRWNNAFLVELDLDFKNLIYKETIPCLRGAEAIENHMVFKSFFGWFRNKVLVEKESAGRYFGEVTRLANTDHFSSVKPNNFYHPSYMFLKKFYSQDFSKPCQIENAQEKEAPKTVYTSLTDGKGIICLVVEGLGSEREVICFPENISIEDTLYSLKNLKSANINQRKSKTELKIIQKELVPIWENYSIDDKKEVVAMFLTNNEMKISKNTSDLMKDYVKQNYVTVKVVEVEAN